jgi:hypothetical protein
MAELTDVHRAILEFEGRRWSDPAAKAGSIREEFGHSLLEHHQVLAWLIRQPAAMAHAPATVRRLRRLRDARLEARRAARASA